MKNQLHLKSKLQKKTWEKVIGKQGRLAKSIRTVMKAVAAREHKKSVS